MIPVTPTWVSVGIPVSVVHTRIATLPVASVVCGRLNHSKDSPSGPDPESMAGDRVVALHVSTNPYWVLAAVVAMPVDTSSRTDSLLPPTTPGG
jgi:hypothetical protein